MSRTEDMTQLEELSKHTQNPEYSPQHQDHINQE